jgi:flagellar hook-basal body complex protein FliE
LKALRGPFLSTSDLVAFHGATPIGKTVIATMTASTTLTATVFVINSILSALAAKGITSFT